LAKVRDRAFAIVSVGPKVAPFYFFFYGKRGLQFGEIASDPVPCPVRDD
jgi:hypothetical protein